MPSRPSRALRASSDALLRDARRLAALEERKRRLSGDDPARIEVSEEIESIADRVAVDAEVETALVRRVVETEGDAAPSIEETDRDVPAIIAEWREAERDAATAAPGSAERAEADRRIEQLKEEHRAALREQRPDW